ncbi:PREDICTED: probable E3 ubiquitin-protein ligase ARI15 [Camelina sativa]|uniref:RBR-type E3 ubiquitin transferase n=1 Tax=Camelina sativa TaxID=90675 RepID=A0ABM0XD29_CAMSA|nr:PREDICTED: probable E3 ubiquitin-protein ligase ARI15 [Camelina sativa]
MENDGERPYSVLTRDGVEEKMKKQIDDISGIFLVSKSDATVLLMRLRWDSLRASERLDEDKEKLLTESGLKSVVFDSNLDSSDDDVVSCGICSKIGGEFSGQGKVDDVDVDLISTPFCAHTFCKTCWSEYLEKNFFSLEENKTAIPCPHRDCRSVVGPDTVEKLTVRDQDMYKKYVLRSYREENRELKIKQCPTLNCGFEIEFDREKEDDEHSLNVVCLCGHVFCWRCMLESHRPVTCNNANDWLSRDLKNLLEDSYISSSLSWVDKNTKTCPHCFRHVQFDSFGWSNFVTCACSGQFCWRCLGPSEGHVFGNCVAPSLERIAAKPVSSCLDLWDASQISLALAKSELEAFEPTDLKEEQDIKVIKQGLMLIVQCRQFLKWICVYDYLHTDCDMAKREYLRFLKEHAATLVQSFSETIKKEAERAKTLGCERVKLSTDISNIGNYFYHFVNTLRDGLVEVKAKSYDNYGGPYWLCDRCTYGNSWFIKKCMMCIDPIL